MWISQGCSFFCLWSQNPPWNHCKIPTATGGSWNKALYKLKDLTWKWAPKRHSNQGFKPFYSFFFPPLPTPFHVGGKAGTGTGVKCAVSVSLAGGLCFPRLLSVLLSSGSARNLWECAGEGSTCPAETQIQDNSGFQTPCMVFMSVLAQPLSTPGCSSQTFLVSICTTNKPKQIGWGSKLLTIFWSASVFQHPK